MKKLFEWVKASPDNLPKDGEQVFLKVDGEFDFGKYDKETGMFLTYFFYRQPLESIEFLRPVEQEPVDEDEIWGSISDVIGCNPKSIVISALKRSFIIKKKP